MSEMAVNLDDIGEDNRRRTQMRITRVLIGSAAVITAAASMGLAAAGPASASVPPGGTAKPGVWHAFGNTNPTTVTSSSYVCNGSRQIAVNVIAQVCVVVSADSSSVQPAVIVRNNKPVEYNTQASVTLVDDNTGKNTQTYECAVSGVAPNTWSVCFGDTVANFGPLFAEGEAGLSVDLGATRTLL